MTKVDLLQMTTSRTHRAVRKLVPAAICLTLAACSVNSSGMGNDVVRDNNKVYSYRSGMVHCDDGHQVPYHPTDYEKANGFSLPAICDYH